MIEFWDERFGSTEYAYGERPNQFFKEELKILNGGKILFPAEGEGRNVVYAASAGFNAWAFDPSTEGKSKADRLAEENRVDIDYQVASYESAEYPQNYFDAIVLIFAHMPGNKRQEWHRKLLNYLKNGGYVILQGFSKEQMNYNSGGPGKPEMLFSIEELTNDFAGMEIIKITSGIIQLDEGIYHQGDAAVISAVFRKV